MLVSAVTGSERVLSSATDAVLEGGSDGVKGAFSHTQAYVAPWFKGNGPRPFASLDAMWRAFRDFAHNKTPAVNGGETIFSPPVFRRERSHPPRRGPDPPIMGVDRAECQYSRFRGKRDRAIIRLSYPSLVHLTLGLTRHRTAGH